MATRIVGVLNLTPDSFSDGGQFRSVGDAVAAGLALFVLTLAATIPAPAWRCATPSFSTALRMAIAVSRLPS